MADKTHRRQIMQQIGWGIGRAMLQEQMSQYKLADELQARGIGYGQMSVSFLVNGKTDVAFSVIMVISEILGVSIDHLYAMGTQPLRVPLGRPPAAV